MFPSISSIILSFLYNQLFGEIRRGGLGHRSTVKPFCLNEIDFKIRIKTEMLNALFKHCEKSLNVKDFKSESYMKGICS